MSAPSAITRAVLLVCFCAMRCLLFLAFALSALPAQAQRPRVPDRVIQEELSAPDSAHAARFRLAQSFVGAAQIERAIAILEDLYADRPSDNSYYNALKEAYEAVKRYDDAIFLIDGALARDVPGAEHQLVVEKARILYLNGDERGALATWDGVLDSAGDQERLYRLVYESMMQVRLIDRAILALERGRAGTERPELFQTELAYLHSLVGAHDKAMDEYLALLSVNARQINYVRGRLSQALQQEGAMEASLPIIDARVRHNPDIRSFRELFAWMLMEDSQYQRAFEEYRILSREEEEEGRILYDFATQAADMGAFEIAATAFGEVLDEHPDAPVAADAQLGLAGMHRRHGDKLAESTGADAALPHYEATVAAYRSFLNWFPGHTEYPEVLRRIGDLQQNVFFRHDDAELTLLEVVRRYPNSAAAHQARFDLGRLAIDRNQLEAARIIFELLEADLGRHNTLADRASFERALIHFYQGELAIAGVLLSSIKQKTTSDVANDAIELRVLLLENPGPDSANAAVQQFAAAKLLFRRRQVEETIDATDKLLGYWGQHPIADDTRYLRAQALRAAHRTDEALLAFGELPLVHANSPLADRSLYQYATILDDEMGRPAEALKAYYDLLLRFPGSLLVPEVRERIRSLRSEGV